MVRVSKPPVKFQGISVPITLINEIKKHISKNDKYRSIGEFTRDALRQKMDKDIDKDNKKLIDNFEEVKKQIQELKEEIKKLEKK